ncbi:MAG: amino acid permease [Spirochaetaceae bacterium]|nr:amino acid permease [Myxococcales bacterium]MCB9725155.1 amino acid permease [Spirochaetaceae bacterium]
MLKRVVSFPLLLLYGLGTTIGAGIYALIGPVAGRAGSAAPIAFVIAALLASITAVSFATLSARYPLAGGQAIFFREAFGERRLASGLALVVATTGAVSAAAIVRAFVGYVVVLAPVPPALLLALSVALLVLLAWWGIEESLVAAGLFTLIEILGLLLVIWAGREALGDLPARAGELWPGSGSGSWSGVFAAGLLAFYAFLGFEDMVNVAEEVRRVRRIMPLAIAATLVLSTLLYVLVAVVSVLVVPPEVLAESEEALALVYRVATGSDSQVLRGIAVLAMLNGALIQIVMASRVLYGLAGEPFLPSALGHVDAKRGTPDRATLVVGAGVLGLALFLPVDRLAAGASALTLLVFVTVNASLFRLLRRDPALRASTRVPAWLPLLGLVSNLLFLVASGWLLLAGGESPG